MSTREVRRRKWAQRAWLGSLLLLHSHEPWSLILCSGEDETTDENPESQEMLEEQLVRMLTREVMDLISKWRGNQGSKTVLFLEKQLVTHLHVCSNTDRLIRNNELNRD